jgi:hypothetical protein
VGGCDLNYHLGRAAAGHWASRLEHSTLPTSSRRSRVAWGLAAVLERAGGGRRRLNPAPRRSATFVGSQNIGGAQDGVFSAAPAWDAPRRPRHHHSCRTDTCRCWHSSPGSGRDSRA